MKLRILILLVPIILMACGHGNSDKKIESFKAGSAENRSESKDFLKLGLELMQSESLNELKIGLNVTELAKVLGEPNEKSKSELWGADGAYHQTFKYSNLGIELDLTGEKEADKIVNMITIVSPCNYKTNKGISIGSDYRDVEQAYKDYLDRDFSNSTSLVAGSIYGGLIFGFTNGRVKTIFIGASAE